MTNKLFKWVFENYYWRKYRL